MRPTMNKQLTPLCLAWIELLLCLAICGLVAILSHGAAVTDPVRLGIMLFVIAAVPTGNFIIRRRRARGAE
jgi:hypothetical protein